MKWSLFITDEVWQQKGWAGKLLWLTFLPVSFPYMVGVRVRNFCYSAGWLPSQSLPCAVVSVGNLTVGGTGKTPMTIWLATELGKRGYRPVILSRGYRAGQGLFSRRMQHPNGKASAVNSYDPRAVGDEPAMMARMFGQRVGVGKTRYEAAKEFLKTGKVDVFILDDGYQHRGLKRDLDLLLLGSDSDGWLMPAGPFREPRSGLRRANILVVTANRDHWEPLIQPHRKQGAVFYGTLQPRALVTLDADRVTERPLGLLTGKKIIAVSAIANPRSFYRMIHDCEGEIVNAIEFPDHHEYSTEDWRRINHAARGGDLIVTTEKDLIKLALFPFAREGLFALRISMVIQEAESLIRAVIEAIQGKARCPSDDGMVKSP